MQAVFNDVIASSLTAKPTHAGVELSEPRFKAHAQHAHVHAHAHMCMCMCTACACAPHVQPTDPVIHPPTYPPTHPSASRLQDRFAPRSCGRPKSSSSSSTSCDGVAEARARLADRGWQRRVEAEQQAAQRKMRAVPLPANAAGPRLCAAPRQLGSSGVLRVPGNASAASTSLLVPPQWMFAHFPYGDFFGAMRRCHSSDWSWHRMSALERGLCAPEHRVPCLMMHMAGLRQEQWGRRTLLRALGLWHPSADAVVPEAWVSARAAAAASAATPAARRAAWAAAGPLLVTEGLPLRFSRMGEFDMFAARLLLLGMLTRRRVVMPPIACGLKWMQKALEPRHLRGFEVCCGERTLTLTLIPTPPLTLLLI